MFVSGNFTSAALGPRFHEVLRAIDSDPRAHLRAFEQLFLTRRGSRLAMNDMHHDSFQLRVCGARPPEARAAARQLLTRMASLARAHTSEMAEAADEASSVEIGRQQRELVARRNVLARVARAA
jgi:Spy/CpxP family protein refolding chaperone